LKNVNFANVRPVIAIPATMLALVVGLAAAAAASAADRPPQLIVAILPSDTTVAQIAATPRVAPGLLSAGIGDVPADQTYLDVSQGNRVNPGLYDGDPPPLRVVDGRVPSELWARAVERAEDAPAELVPGLLGATIAMHGIDVSASAGPADLIAVDRAGVIPPPVGSDVGLRVLDSTVDRLPALAHAVAPNGLLIAIAAPTGTQRLLPAGIVGSGFEGDLTSDSTRTDGLVLSIDLAPTILDRLGVDTPDEMNGTEIRAEGDADPSGIADLERRLIDRPNRDLVLLLPLAVWIAIAALVALIAERRAGRTALRLVALAIVWAPVVLLVTAVADAGEAATALAVGLGSVALAVSADLAFGGYLALAVSCAVTVAAYALDVVVGSPYSSLSVLGPNPGYGVRFFWDRQRARGDPDHAHVDRRRGLARDPVGPRPPPRRGLVRRCRGPRRCGVRPRALRGGRRRRDRAWRRRRDRGIARPRPVDSAHRRRRDRGRRARGTGLGRDRRDPRGGPLQPHGARRRRHD
jgi:hypothetical protein